MFYFVKTPWWMRKLYKNCAWQMPGTDKTIYLTFDDGPHPQITNFVLDELQKYNARATFFCIGKNVVAQPSVYKRIIEEGHKVGNHTYDHLNGWKSNDDIYLQNIFEAKKQIDSNLFRPPYGKITWFQLQQLSAQKFKLRTIMWSVLSGDFDTQLSPEKCFTNVMKNTGDGSIVVFHDSEKAFERLQYALPRSLDFFSSKGYRFESIKMNSNEA